MTDTYSDVQSDAYEYTRPKAGLLQSVRTNFVRKVLGIVSIQLLSTGMMSYVTYAQKGKSFHSAHPSLMLLSVIVSIVALLTLAFSQRLRRKVPENYMILGVFTLAESYMVAGIIQAYEPQLIISALFLTGASVFGLTVYSLTTKNDITYFGGLISSLCSGMLVLILINWIFGLSFVNGLIFYGSVLASGLYFVYDLKAILGNDSRKMDLDDYIMGAAVLYVDVVRIFIKILEILGQEKKREEREKKK